MVFGVGPAGTGKTTAAIAVCKRLLEEKALIRLYDPQVSEGAIRQSLQMEEGNHFDSFTFYDSIEDACHESNAIALLTEWEEFKDLQKSFMDVVMGQDKRFLKWLKFL